MFIVFNHFFPTFCWIYRIFNYWEMNSSPTLCATTFLNLGNLQRKFFSFMTYQKALKVFKFLKPVVPRYLKMQSVCLLLMEFTNRNQSLQATMVVFLSKKIIKRNLYNIQKLQQIRKWQISKRTCRSKPQTSQKRLSKARERNLLLKVIE